MSDNSQSLLKRRKAQLEKKKGKRPTPSSASSNYYTSSDTDTSIYSLKNNNVDSLIDPGRITSDSSSNRCYRITNATSEEIKLPSLMRAKDSSQIEQEQKLEQLKQMSVGPILDLDIFDVNYKLSDYDEEAEQKAALELKEKREVEERQRRLAEEERVRLEELKHKRALEESKRKRAEAEKLRVEAERKRFEELERQQIAVLEMKRLEDEARRKKEEDKLRRLEEEEQARKDAAERLKLEEEAIVRLI